MNIFKVMGILIGFSGILFLFLDKIIINDSNYIFALITILGSTFYSIGGILTIRIKNKGNENVTTSTTIWSFNFSFSNGFNFRKTIGSLLLPLGQHCHYFI